ncbi:MAG: class I SAM-dependent methyltransferase [Leptospirales bacterium]|nr:class I SAM-dependent methyltransferase [Leptospirales bacterium]
MASIAVTVPAAHVKPALTARKRKPNGQVICPICRETPLPLYKIERFSPQLNILRCPSCALQMQASLPPRLEDLYTEGYYSGNAGYTYKDERKQERFERYVWKARLERIREFVPAPADFLDIGCAYGGLALEAASMGYSAQGLDISEHAVQEARKRGLKAKQGRLTDELFGPRSIDIATMIEVIEHLEQPRESVAALSRMIRPGGLLVIQTANFNGQQARQGGSDYHYYLPGHLFYFSKSNLTRLLKENGFSRVLFYPGVEFGLLPKLLKSRGSFQRPGDYAKWLRISWYHAMSKLALGNFAMTSAMVLYAFRDSD